MKHLTIIIGLLVATPTASYAKLDEQNKHVAYVDFCEQNKLYNDGFCDDGCPLYDRDCDEHPAEKTEQKRAKPLHSMDFCEQNGLYGDGICDSGCPKTDTDCIQIIEDIVSTVEEKMESEESEHDSVKIFGIIPVELEEDESPWWKFMLWGN